MGGRGSRRAAFPPGSAGPRHPPWPPTALALAVVGSSRERPSHPDRVRLRCPKSFAPSDYSGRTSWWGTSGRTLGYVLVVRPVITGTSAASCHNLRQNQAVEAQLLSEYACQELIRSMRRRAINRRIGCHDPERPSSLDSCLPGRKEDLAQRPFRHLHGPTFQAADRLALTRITAESGDDLVGGGRIVALRRTGNGLGDPRAKERVFAVRFLVAPEARVPDGLDDEREDLVHADGTRLPRGGCINPTQQIHVPGAPQRGTLREDRRAGTHQAVRAFFRLQERNPQARPFLDQPLEPVQKLGLLAGAFVEDGVGQGEEAAPQPELLEQGAGRELLHRLGLLSDGIAQRRLIDAGHVHLSDLLLERHAAQQVIDSLLDQLAGVAIEGSGGLLGPCDAAGQAVFHKSSTVCKRPRTGAAGPCSSRFSTSAAPRRRCPRSSRRSPATMATSDGGPSRPWATRPGRRMSRA